MTAIVASHASGAVLTPPDTLIIDKKIANDTVIVFFLLVAALLRTYNYDSGVYEGVWRWSYQGKLLMNRNVKRWAQMSLCALFFTCMACQGGETQQADEVADVDKKSQAMNKSTQHVPPPEISMDQQIKGAVTDLAARTGVATDAITVREARAVQWSSGAMGCPKPGMNYTQALVPGVRLLLEAKGEVYYYHGRNGRKLFYCPAGRAQAPAYGQGLDVM